MRIVRHEQDGARLPYGADLDACPAVIDETTRGLSLAAPQRYGGARSVDANRSDPSRHRDWRPEARLTGQSDVASAQGLVDTAETCPAHSPVPCPLTALDELVAKVQSDLKHSRDGVRADGFGTFYSGPAFRTASHGNPIVRCERDRMPIRRSLSPQALSTAVCVDVLTLSKRRDLARGES